MCALYAFLRIADDISDEPGRDRAKSAQLAECRRQLKAAFDGLTVNKTLPALVDTFDRYEIPKDCLDAVLNGVEMDLGNQRFATFSELERYCHCVASVVGQACIRIWGFHGSEALSLANDCGLAFQLTNILRDLPEDARRGRIYLPQEDLARFHCSEDQFLRWEFNANLRRLLLFEANRAEDYYASAAKLISYLTLDGKRIFRAMFHTYRGLLHEIKNADGISYRTPPGLTPWRKTGVLLSALLSGFSDVFLYPLPRAHSLRT